MAFDSDLCLSPGQPMIWAAQLFKQHDFTTVQEKVYLKAHLIDILPDKQMWPVGVSRQMSCQSLKYSVAISKYVHRT